jgi:hypothetical protein
MVVLAGVLVLAAVPLVGLGVSARSHVSRVEDATARAREARAPLLLRRSELLRERDEVGKLVAAVPDAVVTIGSASRDVLDAQRQMVDVSNRAIERYNAGDAVGGQSVYATDGARVSELVRQKQAALQSTLTSMQTELDRLRSPR